MKNANIVGIYKHLYDFSQIALLSFITIKNSFYVGCNFIYIYTKQCEVYNNNKVITNN